MGILKRNWARALFAAVVTLSAGAAGAATVYYDLILTEVAGFGAGPYGQVKVEEGTGVDAGKLFFTVSLADGFKFVQTGQHDGFTFEFKDTPDALPPPAIVISDLSAGWSVAPVTADDPPYENAPFNLNWDYALSCTGCGNGGSSPVDSPLTFTVSGMTLAQIGSELWSDGDDTYNVAFGVDIIQTSSGATGAVGAIISPVPEPNTWALLIAGFGIVGFAMRRRPVTKGKVAYA